MPERSAGIAFIESAHPDEPDQMPKPGFFGRLAQRTLGGSFMGDPNSEYNGVEETVRRIAAAGPFPPIPIAVVTGRKKMPLVPADAFALHLDKRAELAALSPDSLHLFAENSGHVPHLTEPKIVLEAIASVVERSAQ